METSLQIDFQGMQGRPEIKTAISEHVAALEQRYGRVTACRVVVKAPGHHHQTGGLFEINIHLSLPDGRSVNVDRTPHVDERHSDLTFAINDAFKRARRQLQDQVSLLRGDVKQHEGPPIGTVKRLDESGEFGFLEAPDGRDVYFHKNSIVNGGMNQLELGSRVTFVEEAGEKGAQASTVKMLGKHGMR
jgi:cold shock CspA family protein/ribosome-associated translation inhibitor RaiA